MTATAAPATTASATTTHQMIFVNLPVADVDTSRTFFAALGYAFDEEMCNEGALALKLGGDHYAMLLRRDFFGQFHDDTIAERGTREVLTCLSAESREVRTEDHGFMYGRSYADLDDHVWEIMWMDVEAARNAGTFG